MNSFLEKCIRYFTVMTFAVVLVVPHESMGMVAVEESLLRATEKGLVRGIGKDIEGMIQKAVGHDVKIKIGDTIGRGLDESIGRLNTLTKDFGFTTKDIKFDKFEGQYKKAFTERIEKLQMERAEVGKKLEPKDIQEAHEFAFDESVKKEFDNALGKKVEDFRAKAAEARSDASIARKSSNSKDAAEFEKRAKNFDEEANKIQKQLDDVHDSIKGSRLKTESFEAALKGQVAVEFKEKAREAQTEDAERNAAASSGKNLKTGATGGKIESVKSWFWESFILGGVIGGIAFSVWNWVQSRIQTTQAHTADLATACLPQYFGGMWLRIPDEFINLADPINGSLPVYVPVAREISSSTFTQSGAISDITGRAGWEAFLYGPSTDDKSQLQRINNALFGHYDANQVLDQSQIFTTAGANRGNYCGQNGWGTETMMSPCFGRRMIHLPTGLEFNATGRSTDQKYPMRQLFGDSLGISSCDTTVETYINDFAGMLLAGVPTRVQYDMFNHNGAFYGTGGSAGIDPNAAKSFVEAYVQKDNKTLFDLKSDTDFIKEYQDTITPRDRLDQAVARYNLAYVSQVREIDPTTWTNLFGVKISRPVGSIPLALSGYGYCVYQTLSTPSIHDLINRIRTVRPDAPTGAIVDYVVPLTSTGADVAPAIVPVVHGKDRADNNPGWIQWEANPRIKYLYSLVSGKLYDVTTGKESKASQAISQAIEGNQPFVSGALKDSVSGAATLLGAQIQGMKSLATTSYADQFPWGGFTLKRELTGATGPYIFRVINKDAKGNPIPTTLSTSDGKYLDDYVVPTNGTLEAVDITVDSDIKYFVSLPTSKIYDASLAEVSEQVPFYVTSDSSGLTLNWGANATGSAKTYATSLGTLFMELTQNPFNIPLMGPIHISEALQTSFDNQITTATSEMFTKLVSMEQSLRDKVVKAFAGRVLKAMVAAGLTIQSINDVIQKPSDPTKAIDAITQFAQKFADAIVGKIIAEFNKIDLTKGITDTKAQQYLQDLVGEGNQITWESIWSAASKKQVDFSALALTIFRMVTTWQDVVNNIANPGSQSDWNWVASPSQSTISNFNNIGNFLTIVGMYSFYSDIPSLGLIPLPKMYLYTTQQSLAKTSAGESQSALAKVVNSDLNQRINDVYDAWMKNFSLYSDLDLAFSQQQVPNVLITPVDKKLPVYTSNYYPEWVGDYFIVSNDEKTVKTVRPFDVLNPQQYLISLFTGNIFMRTDSGDVVQQFDDDAKTKPSHLSFDNLSLVRNQLDLSQHPEIKKSFDGTTKITTWVTYAGRRLYLDPLDEQKSQYIYQDITNVRNFGEWLKRKNRMSEVSDFYIGYTTTGTTDSNATVAFGAPLSAFPGLMSIVTKTMYTPAGDLANTQAPKEFDLTKSGTVNPVGYTLNTDEINQITALKGKAYEGKTSESEGVKKEAPLAVVSQLANAKIEFDNSPFKMIYTLGAGYYSIMKDPASGTVLGYVDYNFKSSITPGTCGIGYYDDKGTFMSALFGDNATYVREIQGLYGEGCNVALGIPSIIPAITIADKVAMPKTATLTVGTKGEGVRFTYDGIYPGSYTLYQYSYPLRGKTIEKDKNGKLKTAVGNGVLAEYTPQGSKTSYYVDMFSGNMFVTTPKAGTVFQPLVAEYPVLKSQAKADQAATSQDQTADQKTPLIVSVSYDSQNHQQVFARADDGYYYAADYDAKINGGTKLDTIKVSDTNSPSSYRFFNGATAFDVSLDGSTFNAFASSTNPMSIQSFTTTDTSIEGMDANDATVTRSDVITSYVYTSDEVMRHYKYVGSKTMTSFDTDPGNFTADYAKTENTHGALFDFTTGLYIQNTIDKASAIFVPAVMADNNANARGFMQCILKDGVYKPVETTKTDDAFKAQFKLYVNQQGKPSYVVVVCQSPDKADGTKGAIEAHYYMPIYNFMDTLTLSSVEDMIGFYTTTDATGNPVAVLGIDNPDKDLRSVQTIFGVPQDPTIQENVKILLKGNAFWNQHAGSYTITTEKEKFPGSSSQTFNRTVITPNHDFLNRYFYKLGKDDQDDQASHSTKSVFGNKQPADYLDLYTGILFGVRRNDDGSPTSDPRLRPIDNLKSDELQQFLNHLGVRPPDLFDNPSLYRPLSYKASKTSQEQYLESAFGPNGRITIPDGGLPSDTPFMYCMHQATAPVPAPEPTTPKSSTDTKSGNTDDSSDNIWSPLDKDTSGNTSSTGGEEQP